MIQAIQRGDTALVEQLLGNDVRPDITDDDGVPALMLATLFADAETVELLLERGASPNDTDGHGASALMWAIPNADKVRLLLEHGADPNARTDEEGLTPLLIAASYPQSQSVLRLLLDAGADLTAVDAGGQTALSRALRFADVGVMRFLVESGLDPSEEALEPVLQAAYSREHPGALDYLMSVGLPVPEWALVVGSNWQPPDLLNTWIERGADVNAARPQYGKTPLMNAASSEVAGAQTLRLLLEHGADPNTANAEGERPLDWAIYRGDVDKIAVLEEFGATRGNGPRRETFPRPASDPTTDPPTSVSRSVSLLLSSAPPMYDNRQCITCHHNTVPAVTAATARQKGIRVDENLAQGNLDDILSFLRTSAHSLMVGEAGGPFGGGTTLGYSAMALAAEAYPSDRITATMTHRILVSQMPDGRWLGNGVNRPPIVYSTLSSTTLAVRTLTLYPIPGRGAEIERSLARAQQWLIAAPATSAEERAMRLLGLVWTEAPRSAIGPAVQQILQLQTATGGWTQQPELDPDAYATGLMLFALREAGIAVSDEAYQQGVEFLLDTQYPDGSWFVPSRAFPLQPYFESGFPFGRHQWVSAAGTAWAALAIAQTLPDSERPD